MRYYLTVSYKSRFILILIGSILLLGSTLLWIENEIRPAMFTLAEAQINRIAARTISRVITQAMQDENETTLIRTSVNEQGKVILIQPDTMRFNTITARITRDLEEELERLQDIPILVPLGQIWGNSLIANYGPQIPIYMKPTGMLQITTQDRFEQVGINQTKHRMYLDVEIVIRIAVPMADKNTTVKTALPLAEYVIIGDVPTTYVELPQNFLK